MNNATAIANISFFITSPGKFLVLQKLALIRTRQLRLLFIAPRFTCRVDLVVLFLLFFGQDRPNFASRLFLYRFHLWARLLENLVKFRARVLGDLFYLDTLFAARSHGVLDLT